MCVVCTKLINTESNVEGAILIYFDYIIIYIYFVFVTLFHIYFWFSGSFLINDPNVLQFVDIGYKLAGTYKCTVTSAGGKSSGNRTLEVYCKSYLPS